MNKKNIPLIWVDLEMTGLDLKTDTIMQIGVKVTDINLNPVPYRPLGHGIEVAIGLTEQQIAGMGEWCQNQHGISGLTERCRLSKRTLAGVEDELITQLEAVCEKGQSPMCGNSVHVDRAFLAKCMPRLSAFFHYRNLDVSTIKQLYEGWYNLPSFDKERPHTCIGDINESIAELYHYRHSIFRHHTAAEVPKET